MTEAKAGEVAIEPLVRHSGRPGDQSFDLLAAPLRRLSARPHVVAAGADCADRFLESLSLEREQRVDRFSPRLSPPRTISMKKICRCCGVSAASPANSALAR